MVSTEDLNPKNRRKIGMEIALHTEIFFIDVGTEIMFLKNS